MFYDIEGEEDKMSINAVTIEPEITIEEPAGDIEGEVVPKMFARQEFPINSLHQLQEQLL